MQLIDPAARPISRRPRGIIFRLSRADLAHEWILTLCLIMAIAAVLSPLLLMFGLKYGTIQTLRHRLIQDPRNREIRPMVSKSFTREWFDQIRARPDVAFVVPTTRQISASIDAQVKDRRFDGKIKKIQLDIIPTAEGDNLILENGAAIPEAGQCVLTKMASEDLGADAGDTIIAMAKRLKGSRYEKGKLNLEVTGILNARASALKAVFVRLEVLEAVERFKDGRAVPEYGWPGSIPTAYPQYNGLMVVLPRELSKIEEIKLISNTGFTKIERITRDQLFRQAGYQLATGPAIYFLSTRKRPVGQESVDSVRRRLRGRRASLIPWVDGLKTDLTDESGQKIAALTLSALTLDPENAAALHLTPSPGWDDTGSNTAGWRKIMLPSGLARPSGPVMLSLTRREESLTFPVVVVPETVSGPAALIPARLAGILNLFKTRNISFDRDLEQFVLARRGYAGFRLYAATIDEVDGLRRHLESMGIPVHTEAARIRDVTELDTYLTLIFWLIAAVGLTGGIAALVASLYASVERKQKELSVLRLIGLSGAALFRFPVYQGVLIGACGFVVATGFFESLAWVINTLFKSHLQAEESLCRLSVWHIGGALAATVSIAIVASTFAAWRATRIDPAEALRDE